MDFSGAIDAVTKPFRKPAGYVSAKEEAAAAAKAAAPAPAPAPPPTQLGGVNLGAIRRREEAAGMKHGGKVKGPGTGTSDSIPAMLSKNEYVMPADSVRKIGVRKLDAMREATHNFGDKPKPVAAGARRKMADGGQVDPLATPAPTPAPVAAPAVGAAPVAAAAPVKSQYEQDLERRNLATAASSIVASDGRTQAQTALTALDKPPAAAPVAGATPTPAATPIGSTPTAPAAAPVAAPVATAPATKPNPVLDTMTRASNTYGQIAAMAPKGGLALDPTQPQRFAHGGLVCPPKLGSKRKGYADGGLVLAEDQDRLRRAGADSRPKLRRAGR
jgi:hypothetical protein